MHFDSPTGPSHTQFLHTMVLLRHLGFDHDELEKLHGALRANDDELVRWCESLLKRIEITEEALKKVARVWGEKGYVGRTLADNEATRAIWKDYQDQRAMEDERWRKDEAMRKIEEARLTA